MITQKLLLIPLQFSQSGRIPRAFSPSVPPDDGAELAVVPVGLPAAAAADGPVGAVQVVVVGVPPCRYCQVFDRTDKKKYQTERES